MINQYQKKILFVHGWGFSKSVWDHVISHLQGLEIENLDLNFFDHSKHDLINIEQIKQNLSDYIIVGHSLGFPYVLTHFPLEFYHYIAINSFTRFSKSDDFQHGVPIRILDRMSKGLSVKPLEVLTQFYQQCGYNQTSVSDFNINRLQQGLAWLKDDDHRALIPLIADKLTIIASTKDSVVSDQMTQDSFKLQYCHWVEDNSHLLPITKPEICADFIQRIA